MSDITVGSQARYYSRSLGWMDCKVLDIKEYEEAVIGREEKFVYKEARVETVLGDIHIVEYTRLVPIA